MVPVKQQRSTMAGQILRYLALIIWMGGLHLNVAVVVFGLVNLPRQWACWLLLAWGALVIIPINEKSPWGTALARFLIRNVQDHFPISIKVVDASSLDPSRAYVLGLEPHSVLPLSLIGLNPCLKTTPFRRLKGLASTAVFHVPVVRHTWSWLGLSSCSRRNFSRLLQDGCTCLLVPGGVQECLYLAPGKEVIFLKRRRGFVRVAIENGAPLVPVFVFGQTQTFKWWKPANSGIYAKISRWIGFTPLLFWGMWGTPIPFPHPMHMVIGQPIEVKKNLTPAAEEVAELHSKFVAAMVELFEKHKHEAGHPNLELVVL